MNFLSNYKLCIECVQNLLQNYLGMLDNNIYYIIMITASNTI